MAPVIISTDKTQLTQFSGGKMAYPVYLTLGNIPRAIRRKPSQNACILIGYLSVSKEVGENLTKKQQSARVQQLFHDSMRIILDPLIKAGREGVEITGGDGQVRRVHPILAAYVADYPEQCLVTCSKYGTCPRCQVTESELQDRHPASPRIQRETVKALKKAKASATSMSHYQQLCRIELISGGITRPFWEGFPFCDIHLSMTPDILHQLYHGIVKYLTLWCTSLIDNRELDQRIRTLPPCFGVRHFHSGWSKLSQIAGKERKDMARILLGVLVGKVPSQVLTCYRALLDFIYLAQYPTHDDDSLQWMEDALDLFHQNKTIFLSDELGIREHLNIPKLHSLVHYVESIRNFGTTDNYNTEAFERFHIDMAKEGWRASNFRNEVPQMTRWLERQEKISLFQSYVNYKTNDDAEEDEEEPANSRSTLTGLVIAQQPAVSGQTISSIQKNHDAPSFGHHLRNYLNTLLPPEEILSRLQVPYAHLPFHKVDVWHTCKFALDVLGNDVDGQEGVDSIKAKPGRFDIVAVAYRGDAESTGLQGELPSTSNNNFNR